MWEYLPDTIWLQIFSYLDIHQLSSASKVCRYWSQLAMDQVLWKKLLHRDFHINPSINKASDLSWREEYRRLSEDVPCVLTETMLHADSSQEVLHVSFSHDSTMFATVSKDANVVVWDTTGYPIKEKYRADASKLLFEYCYFSEFNSSDTLLLVSGIVCGTTLHQIGKIVVFSLSSGLTLQCLVGNLSVRAFGCWISDKHLLSTAKHFLPDSTTYNLLLMFRASQELQSELFPVVERLYMLHNSSTASIGMLTIANNKVRTLPRESKPSEHTVVNDFSIDKNPLTFHYTPEYLAVRSTNKSEAADYSELTESSEEASESGECEDQDSMDRKMLIYTSYKSKPIPHIICFKYIENVRFPKTVKPGLTIKERLAARLRRVELSNDASVEHLFDKPDHCIDVQGMVIGMALSPDHRYLHVNVRNWFYDLEKCERSSSLLSSLASMLVVDLETLSVVGSLTRPDKPWNFDCDTSPSVSALYVGSGAEDGLAYVWDRTHGIPLLKLRHPNYVNSIAFSGSSNLLVTVCKDSKIRVYRTRREVRRLGLEPTDSSPSGVTHYRDKPEEFREDDTATIIDRKHLLKMEQLNFRLTSDRV